MARRALIIGCGSLGEACGRLLLAGGWEVCGVRRRPGAADPGFPIVAGDAADAEVLNALGPAEAVLCCANPGLRDGGDNGLLAAAEALAARHRDARLVYTGSTAVYAEAGGARVAEEGRLAEDARALGLLAIEAAILVHPRALVLRVGALVGGGRDARPLARLRAAGSDPIVVRGDPSRPFSFLHEDDAALVCAELLAGEEAGIWNACAPLDLTWEDYYRRLARAAGLDWPGCVGDGTAAPSRRVVAPWLWERFGGHCWLAPGASGGCA